MPTQKNSLIHGVMQPSLLIPAPVYRAVVASLLVLFSSSASAEASGDGVAFSLGVSANLAPEYRGSADSDQGFSVSIEPHYIKWAGKGPGAIGSSKEGFSLKPVLTTRSERKASDHKALAGLDDVSGSVELGAKLQYKKGQWNAYSKLLHGIKGHSGNSLELGGAYTTNPNDKLKLTLGSYVSYGDKHLMDTYYSVNADVIGWQQYQADAGIEVLGVRMGADYQLNKRWALTSKLEYMQWGDEMKASPIVESDDGVSASLGLMRRFSFMRNK